MTDPIRAIIEGYFGEDLDAEVFDSLETVEVPGGRWLFQEGDPGDALFFVVRGRLQAWAGSGDDKRLLGEVLPGDSVGEAGLLTGEARSAGIRAIRDSLLVRLDKAPFEALANRHPGLVMKLASHVARLMQRNLTGAGGGRRGYRTICLVALHDTPQVQVSREAIVGGLCGRHDAVALSPARLTKLGAPSVGDAQLSEPLLQWLADREAEEPLLLYLCGPDESPWTRFALRQSDMVVFLADAGETPARSAWERSLEVTGARLLVLHHESGRSIEGTAHWLEDRAPDLHLHVREDEPGDRDRVIRMLSGTAIGLVLGAGAVRGLAELGVYKAMVQLGIPVDWVGGSSIGSIVGGAVAMDWTPEHAIAMARESFVKGKPFSDYTVPVISLIRGQRMVKLLKAQLDVNIEDLPIPFFCVSSRLDRGEVHVHERGALVDAIRASAALPGVLPPAVVDEELVVDGAVLNNLPVDIMRDRPVGKIIAVDVSSRHTRRVDYEETPSSWAVLRSRWLPFTQRHRVPGLTTLILRSTEIGTLVQARQRGASADLLINPPVRQFRMTDVKAFDPIVQVGYEHGLESLRAWLDQKDGAS